MIAVLTGTALRAVASDGESHIRVVDPRVDALIDHGLAESPTFRAVVAQLEAAPLLVFVRCQSPTQQAASAAGLTFLARTPTYRYVRIFMRCELPAAVQLPLMAHEFQHALEVASATDIVDGASLRSHYERIGYRSNADERAPSFDTGAAIEVQRQVTRELSRTHPHAVARITLEPHTWQ